MPTASGPAAALLPLLLLCSTAILEGQPAGEVPETPADRELLVDALSAAPAGLAREATVVDWEGRILRAGTNGWICYPDAPDTPLPDPMCLDGPLQELLEAWLGRKKPAFERIGFGYMLQGGGGESAANPYADHPDEVDDWIVAGPHLLVIVPDPELLEGLPTTPERGEPWVMWKGTPYAHVMVPVPPPAPGTLYRPGSP